MYSINLKDSFIGIIGSYFCKRALQISFSVLVSALPQHLNVIALTLLYVGCLLEYIFHPMFKNIVFFLISNMRKLAMFTVV